MGNECGNACIVTSSKLDSIADALGHRARRQLLMELCDYNRPDYRDVIGGVARSPPDAVRQLIHIYQPTLDDRGDRSWDRDDEIVAKGQNGMKLSFGCSSTTSHRDRAAPSGALS